METPTKQDLKARRKNLNLDSEKTIERPSDVEISKEGRVEFEEKRKPQNSQEFREMCKKEREERDKKKGITYENGGQQFCPVAKEEMSEEEKEEAKRREENSAREKAILNDPENVSNFSTKIQSRDQMVKLAVFLINHNMVPSSFKTVGEVVMAIQTAMSLGYNKFGSITLAIKHMYIINNCVNLWGELPMSVVNRTGLIKYFEEYFLNKAGDKICEENKNLGHENHTSVCKIQESREIFKPFI